MRTVFLARHTHIDSCTRGVIVANGLFLHTLELPWLDNQSNISCIPTGEYLCEFMPRSSSGKYKNVYHVKDVEGRYGILIHNGNVPAHTKGCILVGMSQGVLAGQQAVLSSRSALANFVDFMNKESFKLRVLNYGLD